MKTRDLTYYRIYDNIPVMAKNNSYNDEKNNALYYGDNLFVMREHIASESVDLIYLDPPFNSKRNYNVLFKDESGIQSDAQIKAFEDSWHWNIETEQIYAELMTDSTEEVAAMIEALCLCIGKNPMMAYLVMMTVRLIELHRVLKSTGSIYLHCDPTASHYLKFIMDVIFGKQNFRNEIIWHYRRWTGSARSFLKMHDTILFYTKSDEYTFNRQFTSYTPASLKRKKHHHTRIKGDDVYVTSVNKNGVGENDVWQIQLLNSQSKERLGYPTQKPETLLEKIIHASSNKGDVILDPFCGCGTTIAVAERLERKWIGIDITHLGIAAIKSRVAEHFPNAKFKTIGEPEDLDAAKQLAHEDRYQFQWWALSLIKGAKPSGGDGVSRIGKKGADRGIDGFINFRDDYTGQYKKVLIQVKSGHVNSSMIRDLKGAVQRENAAMGVFVTLENSTKDMRLEADTAGFYHSVGYKKNYPKIQISPIHDLLTNVPINMPESIGIWDTQRKIIPQIEQIPLPMIQLEDEKETLREQPRSTKEVRRKPNYRQRSISATA